MSRRGGRGRRGGGGDPRAGIRPARVAETIRRILAEELSELDDERLELVSFTSVEVDPEYHRALVWYTTYDPADEAVAAEALAEHAGELRRAVGARTRLRRTPELHFRPDEVVRSAERIEGLLAGDDRTGPDAEPDGGGA